MIIHILATRFLRSAYNNYSDNPFPAWPGVPMLCLPRGLEIIEGEGASLRDTLPLPLNVISDAVQRDINTSLSLIAGLGYANVPLTVDGNIFNPAGQ